MITKWMYSHQHALTSHVKEFIATNNLNAVDVGASVYYWSYPECKTVIDMQERPKDDVLSFTINLDRKTDLQKVLDHVNSHGKFDYSICSHTLEDVYNPFQLAEFLSSISKQGYIASPSKYDEFQHHYGRPYLGHAHHKTIIDVIDNTLVLFPKYPFIEVDERSKLLTNPETPVYKDIVIFWENEIPVSIFGSDEIFSSDDALMSRYYEMLTVSKSS